jgi:hypothetical protein
MTQANEQWRVLSLWEPWATLTVTQSRVDSFQQVHMWKEWETRHWHPTAKLRLQLPIPVVIHATRRVEKRVFSEWPFYAILPDEGARCRPGHLLGVATIVEVVTTEGKPNA